MIRQTPTSLSSRPQNQHPPQYPQQYPNPQHPIQPPSNTSPQQPAQRYFYPPPDAVIYQPHNGNRTNPPIFCLTPESVESNRLPQGPGPQYFIQSLTETERTETERTGHRPSPIACGSAEFRYSSPPPQTNTPPELNDLRLQSISELARMFHDPEKTRVFMDPGTGQLQPTASAIQYELMTYGQNLQTKLLAQVLPPPPANRLVPHPYLSGQFLEIPSNGQEGMHHPPLFPSNIYQTVAPQTPSHPGVASNPLVPNSPWDTPLPQHTPGHYRAAPHTQLPPMTATPFQAMPRTSAIAPGGSATPVWGLAQRISDWKNLDSQISLSALKIVKPLMSCPDRHHMTEVLSVHNLPFLPNALEWLARFNRKDANELGMCALLHFVDHDEIVPSIVTDALLSAVNGTTEWPRDAKDVGLVLSKLKQQPDARFYQATNALISRLLCPDR